MKENPTEADVLATLGTHFAATFRRQQSGY